MSEEQIRKLINESLKDSVAEEFDIDEIPRSSVDMSPEEESAFDLDGAEEIEDDFLDIKSKFRNSDDYEGGYENDVSISPGYFNEEEVDPIAAAKTSGKSNHNFVADAIEYAGEENWNMMSDAEREEIISDLERSFDMRFTNESKTIKINQEQLQGIIREGVQKLHKKNLIESRIEKINQELNDLSNTDAWENSRKEAQKQLRQNNVAWNNLTNKNL